MSIIRDMSNTQDITYHDYLAWIASLAMAVEPYTEHQWDTMSSINKFGICLSVRDWKNSK